MPYLLAEVLALTVMGSFWGLSVQLVTFREQGILRRFRVAPIGASAMLASSIISNYFLTIPTVVIEFYLSRQVFHMSSMGNLLGVFVLITLGIATFATLGLVIAQRHEHDAGNPDYQPDYLVCFPVSFRRVRFLFRFCRSSFRKFRISCRQPTWSAACNNRWSIMPAFRNLVWIWPLCSAVP